MRSSVSLSLRNRRPFPSVGIPQVSWGCLLVLCLGAMTAPADIAVAPSNTGVVTWLPGAPLLTDLDGTRFTQHSTSNFTVSYELPTEFDWDGIMVRWKDFATENVSAIPTFVFGVRGDPDEIKVEFEDTNSIKTIAHLQNVSNSWQYYAIPATAITNDITRMKVISFVVDHNMAGAGNYTGTFEVIVQGLTFDWRVDGSPTGPATALPNLPKVLLVGGANSDTVLVNTNATVIDISYAVPTGWSGASIVYDNRDTWPTNEFQSLMGFTNLVFGLWGDTKNVKVEFLDSSNAVMIATATNVGTGPAYYYFATGLLSNRLSEISAINFVVDSNLVGSGKLTGTLHIASGGLDYPIRISGAGSGPATVLPGEPAVDAVGGASSGTVVSVLSDSEILVQYSVTSGWSGASILYDDFTTGPVESSDLSSFPSLVFGISGTPSNVKCEVQDSTGHKAAATFTAIGPGLEYFAIESGHLTDKGVDRAHVSVISFVVDAALAGSNHLSGSLYIESGGLAFPLQLAGAVTGSPTILPPTPLDVTAVGGANPDTQVDQLSSSRFRVTYHVASGWSGGSILYDDFGSGPIETGDFSSLTTVVFAVRGDPGSVKLEFEDASTNKVEAVLLGVTNSLRYYEVSVPVLSNKGLKVQSVRMISFVVDSNRAGAAHLSGRFEVYSGGLTFRNLVYGKTDSDGDGLPDDWEEGNGTDPADDGSGNPANGAAGDEDGDGADNYEEYIAGTSATNGAQAPEIELMREGTNIVLATDGVGRREYRFYETDDLCTGVWARVGPALKMDTNAPVLAPQAIEQDDGRFYRCSIRLEDVTRLPGRPAVVVIGGGESNTVLLQLSSREFSVQYNVTSGWAGATLLYDDYGTPGIESCNYGAYSELAFAISGTPQSVKYEVEDASGQKIAGLFRYVTNALNRYTLDTSLLSAAGVDLSQIRFINFLVDAGSAGTNNLIGAFSVQTWGLNYLIETAGQGAGAATTLPAGPPVISNLGGGQSTNHWNQQGVTNIVVPYNVTATDSWDGVSILYDNYGTPQLENADFSDLSAVTFGIRGTPLSVKAEFEDIAANKVLAYFRGVTNTAVRYYAVALDDLEAGGLDPGHVRFINFVVDQNAAGPGNYTGTFSIVTGGLSP
ncbi:MAG: thrombospondin type 3 repeat-containing protein [Verrucomicrobiota bacterium]